MTRRFEMKHMDAKQTAFVAMMSALGTVLSLISLNIAPISVVVPGQGAAALDLSHLATFVAAIFGGPFIGGTVGFLSGIYAGYYFGYVAGGLGLLSVIGIPLGKAFTGLLAGFLYKRLRIGSMSRHSILAVPVTLLSYVPESIYTVIYFLYIVTWINIPAMTFMIPWVIPKAWIEIAVMSFIMAALAGNTGFREFINRFLYIQKPQRSISKQPAVV
jgi:LytS/YehU family sensor histidine kinase